MDNDELLDQDGFEDLADEAELSLETPPADASPEAKELAEFARTAGDVNQVPFDQLTPAMLGQIDESRFAQYLEWRQVFGGVDEEEPEPPEMPGYGSMSEADFAIWLNATVNSQEAS